jgi:transposase
MSNFRPVDRDTGFLMPPSVDDWLPDRHRARFVVEVIVGLELRAMTGSYRGSGEKSYHPSVLLGLLVLVYASGVFSRRKLERASYNSVAFRFIAANQHPDHDTIATFRWRFLPQIEALFVQVLMMVRENAEHDARVAAGSLLVVAGDVVRAPNDKQQPPWHSLRTPADAAKEVTYPLCHICSVSLGLCRSTARTRSRQLPGCCMMRSKIAVLSRRR